MKTVNSGNEKSFVNIEFPDTGIPEARYTSGLAVYDEVLLDGQWVGRYWSATGRVKPEAVCARQMASVKDAHTFRGEAYPKPIHAFELEIDGQRLHDHWKWVSAREEKDEISGARHAVVELAHEVRPVGLKIHTRLDGTCFFKRWLEITNSSDKPAALAAVSPWSGLLWTVHEFREILPEGKENLFSLGRFQHSCWGREGDFGWTPLGGDVLRMEGRNGYSGWGMPFFILRNDVTGEYFAAHLAWSANWMMEFFCDQEPASSDSFLFFKMGPAAPAPQVVISPGETVTSPAVHLGHMHTDLDGCVQAIHRHLRSSVIPAPPKGKGLRITYGSSLFAGEERLKEEVDIAAEAGCEMFDVDAVWHGAVQGKWSDNVGDWEAGQWLPNGLEAIREYVRKKGLLFCLWMEGELMGGNSRILQEHRDWAIRCHGRPVYGERVIDLTIPEAAEWVESEFVRVIRRYDLDVLRIDVNPWVFEGGQRENCGYVENTFWRHYEVLYGIYDRIRKEFPQLVMENAGSGACRSDIGMLSRFHTNWGTDYYSAPRGLLIQRGMTMALPPEMFEFCFGPQTYDQGVRGDLDFQLRIPLFGHYWVTDACPTLREKNPDFMARLRHHLDIYKNFVRPMLPTCKVFHHTPVLETWKAHDWCVIEYAAADESRSMAGIFRLTGGGGREYAFRPRGLDEAGRYRVTFENTGRAVEREGLELAQKGLTVRLESPLTSELLLFERI